ncbi:MAG: hypothetical protein NTW96_25970 [Planctomycetia bacterium]|nr:hypothetical protein [Planctomycetia bacterium]
MKNVSYQSSPIKRTRRTKREIEAIREAIRDLLAEENPMTVRQVFYRLVSMRVIDKTEAEYQNTVRQLGVMRRAGLIPYSWIADATRWMRKPDTHGSLDAMLRYTASTYRHALWDAQAAYVEIWLEKDALAGVLYDVTARWDVPLMVTRGYPSLSFLHTAAEQIRHEDRPCYLYYFGDLDPSGVDIPRKVEQDIREFAPDVEIHFQRVAVTREQVEMFDLPTRPTKRSDSRSRSFKGESVEVDAIPPKTLREIVEILICQHIDADALERTRRVEMAERDTLRGIVDRLAGNDGYTDAAEPDVEGPDE